MLGVIVLGGGIVFFIELARFFYLFYFGNYFIYFTSFVYFTSFISFNYFVSFPKGIGAYFGWGIYYFLFGAFELFGGILFCEFLGYSTCFMFCRAALGFLVLDPVFSSFLMTFALYIFCMLSFTAYFLASILFFVSTLV